MPRATRRDGKKVSIWILVMIACFIWTDAALSSPVQRTRQAGQAGQRGEREGGLPAENRGQAPRPPDRNGLTPARPPIRDAVEGFYVNRIQRELRLSDQQFARVLPALRQSLQRRNQLAIRQVRTRNRLRQALQAGEASNTEISRLRQELDATNAELRNVQEEFLADVDPELTEAQRANLRIVLPNLENRIRNMIERSRNAAPANVPE